jgi:hypothetical protein
MATMISWNGWSLVKAMKKAIMAFVDADCEDPSNSAINDVAAEDQGGTIEGLHWDTSFKIDELPAGRKPTKGCSVKTQYQYLFKSPIDSFFAIIPYIFWEIFC